MEAWPPDTGKSLSETCEEAGIDSFSTIPSKSLRRLNRFQLTQVQGTDCPKRLCGRTSLQALRECRQPYSIFFLECNKLPDGILPPLRPRPAIDRLPETNDRSTFGMGLSILGPDPTFVSPSAK
jgi:hypothetical protein